MDNNAINRFLIYHSPGTGKSFTALWILLNFIRVFEKKTVILVKSQGFILEFKQRIFSWYSYTFSFLNPLPGITNYQQFINKYLELHTYIIFCKSIASFNDEELVKEYND